MEKDYRIIVVEPTDHHYHWGVGIVSELPNEPIEDCSFLTGALIRAAQDLGWQPFHQGGSHDFDAPCRGRHYIEFWGLDGVGKHHRQVQHFIKGFELAYKPPNRQE